MRSVLLTCALEQEILLKIWTWLRATCNQFATSPGALSLSIVIKLKNSDHLPNTVEN